MNELRIKSETLPERCEICHQQDSFDPVRNRCARCHGIREMVSNDSNRIAAIDRESQVRQINFFSAESWQAFTELQSDINDFGLFPIKHPTLFGFMIWLGVTILSGLAFGFLYLTSVSLVVGLYGFVLGLVFGAIVGVVILLFRSFFWWLL